MRSHTIRYDTKKYDTMQGGNARQVARIIAECNIPCNGHMQTLQDQLQKLLRKVEWSSPFRNDCNEFFLALRSITSLLQLVSQRLAATNENYPLTSCDHRNETSCVTETLLSVNIPVKQLVS